MIKHIVAAITVLLAVALVIALVIAFILPDDGKVTNGVSPEQEMEVVDVTLDDGRVLECIVSKSSGKFGILDCNWSMPVS